VHPGGNMWGRVSYVWIVCVGGLPARAVNRERKVLFREWSKGAQALGKGWFPVLAASVRQVFDLDANHVCPMPSLGVGWT
jgi:hypothetical protein